jgi:hypothetical protein
LPGDFCHGIDFDMEGPGICWGSGYISRGTSHLLALDATMIFNCRIIGIVWLPLGVGGDPRD